MSNPQEKMRQQTPLPTDSSESQNIGGGENQSQKLSEQEQQTFVACEKVIAEGSQKFVDVGKALETVRDSKLYRATHATWSSYCQQRWEMSKSHGDRLIAAAKITTALAKVGVVVKHEWSVRPLTTLKEKQLAKAVKKAQEAAAKKPQPLTVDLITSKAPRLKEYKDHRKPRIVIQEVPTKLKAAITTGIEKLVPEIEALKGKAGNAETRKLLEDMAIFLAQLKKEVA